MSWDVWIHCNGIKFEDAYWNYTHNCNAMMRDAGYDWVYHLDMQQVNETLPQFQAMIETLKANPEKYRAMNPPNGWGNYDELVDILEKMMIRSKEIADRVPNAKWREWS